MTEIVFHIFGASVSVERFREMIFPLVIRCVDVVDDKYWFNCEQRKAQSEKNTINMIKYIWFDRLLLSLDCIHLSDRRACTLIQFHSNTYMRSICVRVCCWTGHIRWPAKVNVIPRDGHGEHYAGFVLKHQFTFVYLSSLWI